MVRKVWIEFEDANGKGLAELDALIELGDLIVVIEAKLTERQDAATELTTLYGPLVDWIYPERRVILVEAYRYCRSADAEHIVPIVAEAKRLSRLHYL